MDRVLALKFERIATGGSQNDEYQTELNPLEDFLAACGISFQGSDQHYIATLDNEIVFVDPVNGILKLSQVHMSAAEHRAHDQLVHRLAESSWYDITRTDGRVQFERWYANAGKTIKIREMEYIRTDGKISQIITRQYDDSGALTETLTETLTRVGGKVTGSVVVLS